MELKDAEVDRKVVYTPFKGCNPKMLEEGIITSVNSRFVHVRYGSNVHSKATDASDIEYISGP